MWDKLSVKIHGQKEHGSWEQESSLLGTLLSFFGSIFFIWKWGSYMYFLNLWKRWNMATHWRDLMCNQQFIAGVKHTESGFQLLKFPSLNMCLISFYWTPTNYDNSLICVILSSCLLQNQLHLEGNTLEDAHAPNWWTWPLPKNPPLTDEHAPYRWTHEKYLLDLKHSYDSSDY